MGSMNRILAVLIIVACVMHPAGVSGRYISDSNYLSLSCQGLASELTRVNAALTRAYNSLSGPALIPIPSRNAEIDRYEGEREAIRRVQDQKRC